MLYLDVVGSFLLKGLKEKLISQAFFHVLWNRNRTWTSTCAGGHLCRHRSSVSSPSKACFYVNTKGITTVLHSCKDFPSSRKLSSDSIDFSVACEPSMRDCKRMTPVLSLLFFWIANANVYGQPLNEVSLPIKWLQCSRWAGVSRMNVIRLLLRC